MRNLGFSMDDENRDGVEKSGKNDVKEKEKNTDPNLDEKHSLKRMDESKNRQGKTMATGVDADTTADIDGDIVADAVADHVADVTDTIPPNSPENHKEENKLKKELHKKNGDSKPCSNDNENASSSSLLPSLASSSSTVEQNSQELGRKYWSTCSSIRSFACTTHSFACSVLLASHCWLCSRASLRSLTHSRTRGKVD